MYRFIETIRAEDGRLQNLDSHRERMLRTRAEHGATSTNEIDNIFHGLLVHGQGRTRVRITYGLGGDFQVQQWPYMRKKIENMQIVDIREQNYPYKYSDRAWIYALLEKSGTDEILMIKDGCVTDCSVANLAFYDGSEWWTPDTPLLPGTQRARLLKTGILQTRPVLETDLSSFVSFRLINAMLPWEDGVEHDISTIFRA